MEAREINLLDPLIFEERVPHEWFTYLRHHAPIYRHPEPGGPGFWVVTRYDDVVEVSRDGVTYSSEQSRGGVVALEDADAAADLSAQGRMMLTMDAPDHTRYRSLVNRGFTPRMINALHAPYPRDGDEDHRSRAGETRLRFRDRRRLRASAAGDRADAGRAVRGSAQALRMEQSHDRQRGSRVRGQPGEGRSRPRSRCTCTPTSWRSSAATEPRDDIVTALLNADIDGDQLSEMDFNVFFLLLAVAGNETTRNALSHGMDALIDHPDQYRDAGGKSRAGAVGDRGDFALGLAGDVSSAAT